MTISVLIYVPPEEVCDATEVEEDWNCLVQKNKPRINAELTDNRIT